MEFLSIAYILQMISQHWILLLLLTVILFLYSHYTKTFDHFRKLGVPFLKPTILFGNMRPRMKQEISQHDFVLETYKYFEGSACGGFFEGPQPVLMVRDLELIKAVMIKDFDHFTDKTPVNSRNPSFFNKMLISLKGSEWKSVRAILTPTFSSGKLRNMENLLQECGKQMTEFLHKRLQDGKSVMEMKELTGRYTLEVMGSCAFGLDGASLRDPEAQFNKMVSSFISGPKKGQMFFTYLFLVCPTLVKFISKMRSTPKQLGFLREVVDKTKADREDPTKRRNDFMQLMVDAAQKEETKNSEEKVMTDEMIQSQAILFILAGFETSSTLLSFICVTLATMPDLQERLRKDIQAAAQKKEINCMYDLINDIALLDQVISETLRRYPPVAKVERICTKPYVLPGTNVQINVGDIVSIPIAGVMHDPEYYPDPKVFNPDRFSPEEKNQRPSQLYLPFGMGPRNCIGLRFALMTTKYCMFYLLQQFKLSPCDKTEMPIKFNTKADFLGFQNGAWLNIERLDTKN